MTGSTVAKWDFFEAAFDGPSEGNPFLEIAFDVIFSQNSREVRVPGFYDGDGAYRVMNKAIKDARIEPSAIGYINVHGTSTPQGDRVEVIAIKRVFGDHARQMPISSTKSMTGHLLGAAGGLEAGITALALRDQILPPTINYRTPDPECDLDIIPNEARRVKLEYALSNSFGFGGTNGALVFKRYEG